MELYKYWVEERVELEVDGELQQSSVYGHSNLSADDARANARANAEAIQARLTSHGSRSRDYQAPVREEIIEEIDEHNLVTRNRYGALVLNSDDTMFVDIDEAPPRGFWQRLFGAGSRKPEDIVAFVEERILKGAAHRGLGFRIYATRAGVRLIVLGRHVAPRSPEAQRLMSDFSADPLYALLCVRQDCYRARLTPKPYRMRLKAHRVSFPRTPDEEAALAAWLARYDEKSAAYAVCRFVKGIGRPARSPIVELHDRWTRATEPLKLA